VAARVVEIVAVAVVVVVVAVVAAAWCLCVTLPTACGGWPRNKCLTRRCEISWRSKKWCGKSCGEASLRCKTKKTQQTGRTVLCGYGCGCVETLHDKQQHIAKRLTRRHAAYCCATKSRNT